MFEGSCLGCTPREATPSSSGHSRRKVPRRRDRALNSARRTTQPARQALHNAAMPYMPTFVAPARFTDAAAALDQVKAIYQGGIAHLRESMLRFVAGEALPGRVRPATRSCGCTRTRSRATRRRPTRA
jgi:hypothetical protein